MSQTTGAGGAAAPGWYADPHDPSQLRWWTGEGWTEHVSAGSTPTPAAAQPVAAQPVAQQPVAPQQPLQPQAVQPAAVQPGTELPSRRALRDPATEASEAAEAALLAQQQALQAQQAQQAQPVQPVQPVQQAQPAQPVQPVQYGAPQTPVPQQPDPQAQFPPQQMAPQAAAPQFPAQASAPVPTLPVQPKSFLEQAGYAPMDATPAAANAWNQPAQPASPQPQAAQPAGWAPQQGAPQQPAGQVAPAQGGQPAWNQPPTQNQWNQPVAPVQPGWDAPGAPGAAPAAPQDGIDSLFGGGAAAPSAAPAFGAPDQGAWGLSPTGQAGQVGQDGPSGSRRRGSESSAPESSGSGTLWGWLIAISPILAAGAIGYVIVSTGYVVAGFPWPLEAAIAAPYLLVLLFALADRSALHTLGHSEPRSPGWALLSAPVYLIVRAGETRREDGSGTALTLVWFFSFLVAIAGFVGWGFLTHHALVTGLPISF